MLCIILTVFGYALWCSSTERQLASMHVLTARHMHAPTCASAACDFRYSRSFSLTLVGTLYLLPITNFSSEHTCASCSLFNRRQTSLLSTPTSSAHTTCLCDEPASLLSPLCAHLLQLFHQEVPSAVPTSTQSQAPLSPMASINTYSSPSSPVTGKHAKP